MTTFRILRPLIVIFAAQAAAACLARADSLGLDRTTPVPAGEQIPAMDFFRPAILADPKLNHSGTHIAARVTASADRYQLMVNQLNTQKIEMLSAVGDNDIYGFEWLDDNRIVFGIGLQKLFGIGLYAADIDNLANCYPLLQYVGSELLAVPPGDRLRPLAIIAPDSMNSGSVGRVVMLNTEVKTGKIYDLLSPGIDVESYHAIEENNQLHVVETYPGPQDGLFAGYLADKDGRLAFAFTGEDGIFTMYRLDAGAWKRCPVDLEAVDILGCGRTPNEVLVIGPRQEGKPRALRYMNAATGELGDVLLQDPSYDFNGSIYRDPVTREVLGATIERVGPRTVWFSPEYRGLQRMMEGSFPGVAVRLIGSNDAASVFLVVTYSDRQPPVYYWVDLAKHAVGLIKKSFPWIDPQRMRPMVPVKYKTRDGRTLYAYLTLPAGASKASPPPLVVLPGEDTDIYRSGYQPEDGRNVWGYDREVQFLASRGYAVLQPNHRGSAGYKWMFPKADQWDFRKMGGDVTDAAKTLAASGLVDSRRIAVMGANFGAYLAMASAEDDPQLYRCVVATDGTYDWSTLMGYFADDKHDSAMYGRMERLLGNPHKEPEKFKALSVAASVGGLGMPVLISYQKMIDSETMEGKQLASALENAGVKREVNPIGSDRFALNYVEYRVKYFERVESFLAQNLGPSQK